MWSIGVARLGEMDLVAVPVGVAPGSGSGVAVVGRYLTVRIARLPFGKAARATARVAAGIWFEPVERSDTHDSIREQEQR
jgi:hypothetical protein